MLKIKYHDQIIRTILENPQTLEQILGYIPVKILPEFKIGNGDIDIYVQGPNAQNAIFEVNGHPGLINHYLRKQLPKYQQRFPLARQFCITGTSNKSLNINDFNFHEY